MDDTPGWYPEAIAYSTFAMVVALSHAGGCFRFYDHIGGRKTGTPLPRIPVVVRASALFYVTDVGFPLKLFWKYSATIRQDGSI